jgi:hypothetical protein
MLFLVSTLGVSSDVQTLFSDIAVQVHSDSSYGTIRVHVYNYSYDFFFIYPAYSGTHILCKSNFTRDHDPKIHSFKFIIYPVKGHDEQIFSTTIRSQP